jgi:hypothetical protein
MNAKRRHRRRYRRERARERRCIPWDEITITIGGMNYRATPVQLQTRTGVEMFHGTVRFFLRDIDWLDWGRP